MIRSLVSSLTLRIICTWLLMILGISTVSAWFLIHLQTVTHLRDEHLYLVYFLPFIGLIVGWIYFTFGKELEQGNNLVIKRIVGPQDKPIRFLMAPFIYFSTLIAHLFGASVGREGTAIQYSAGITDELLKRFHIPTVHHKLFLQSAVAAGFASVFGTPITGILFAMEWTPKAFNWKNIPVIAVSAYAAYFVGHLWEAPHTVYDPIHLSFWSWNYLWIIPLAGIVFGATTRVFILLTNTIKTQFINWFSYPPLRPFVGGILLVALFMVVQDASYLGLGIPTIQKSFKETALIYVFVIKLIFTAISIASGFKGGEVTPLFFIGATLGSALSLYLPIDFALLAALGFIAVFAGATNTPLACAMMGLELFGYEIIWLAVPTCYIAYLVSGNNSIYSAQVPLIRKISLFGKA